LVVHGPRLDQVAKEHVTGRIQSSLAANNQHIVGGWFQHCGCCRACYRYTTAVGGGWILRLVVPVWSGRCRRPHLLTGTTATVTAQKDRKMSLLFDGAHPPLCHKPLRRQQPHQISPCSRAAADLQYSFIKWFVPPPSSSSSAVRPLCALFRQLLKMTIVPHVAEFRSCDVSFQTLVLSVLTVRTHSPIHQLFPTVFTPNKYGTGTLAASSTRVDVATPKVMYRS
jgi:hypothetical protein